MTTLRRTVRALAVLPLVAVVFATAQCGGTTPSAPTSTASVANVLLTPSTVAAGVPSSGVVNLTSAAPAGGVTVTLVSSNSSVATVPATVVLPGGTTSGAFAVATADAGTSAISASMGGVSSAATLTVTAKAVLASLALSSDHVVGGGSVLGTVALTDVAGAGGATVLLSTGDPVSVPASVTIPSGQRSATFTASTRAVAGTIAASIRANYANATLLVGLSVQAVAPANVAVAGFGISGSASTDTCLLVDGATRLECRFDGSLSTAPGTIIAWDWTYTVLTTLTQTTTGPVLDLPAASCGFIPAPPLGSGLTSFPLTVTLRIRDSLGNVSAVESYDGARVIPNGFCGF